MIRELVDFTNGICARFGLQPGELGDFCAVISIFGWIGGFVLAVLVAIFL